MGSHFGTHFASNIQFCPKQFIYRLYYAVAKAKIHARLMVLWLIGMAMNTHIQRSWDAAKQVSHPQHTALLCVCPNNYLAISENLWEASQKQLWPWPGAGQQQSTCMCLGCVWCVWCSTRGFYCAPRLADGTCLPPLTNTDLHSFRLWNIMEHSQATEGGTRT